MVCCAVYSYRTGRAVIADLVGFKSLDDFVNVCCASLFYGCLVEVDTGVLGFSLHADVRLSGEHCVPSVLEVVGSGSVKLLNIGSRYIHVFKCRRSEALVLVALCDIYGSCHRAALDTACAPLLIERGLCRADKQCYKEVRLCSLDICDGAGELGNLQRDKFLADKLAAVLFDLLLYPHCADLTEVVVSCDDVSLGTVFIYHTLDKRCDLMLRDSAGAEYVM